MSETSLAKRFLSLFRGRGSGQIKPTRISQSDRLRLSGKGLAVTGRERSFVLELGKQTIHVCPDLPLEPREDDTSPDYLIYDPDRFHNGIAHCLRLKPESSVAIDYRQPQQKLLFSHPRDAFRRHLQVAYKGPSLVFKDPISELGTYLSLLEHEQGGALLESGRRERLEKIREIYGQDFEPLGKDDALEQIREVNRLLRQDPFRAGDSEGNPGGLLELPPDLTPILVGDLHAQVDNLLTLLTENNFLEALEQGDAALIFLGDAVHNEQAGLLDDMDDSVLLMDLVLALKRRFPERVFFLIGNHDSFSTEVMKGGVPQSVLWEKKLKQSRGEEYTQAMAVFYQLSPLVVLSKDFIACHAGPPNAAVSRETLIDARQFPDIVHDLTWNRIKTPNWPVGYSRSQVKRFRKSLELDESLPFIVAHYPQSADGTLWMDAGDIANHHILFSARRNRVALFTRVDDELLPQIFPVKKLRDIPPPVSAQEN